jgi:hypothetical protein
VGDPTVSAVSVQCCWSVRSPERYGRFGLSLSNPLAVPVWAIIEYYGEVPPEVWAVLQHQLPGTGAPVWEFKGNDPFVAVRLAPGAQVTLKNVPRTFSAEDTRARFALATDIRVRGVSADAWVGSPGLMESGTYRLPDEWLEKPWVQRETEPYRPRPDDIRVICTSEVPLVEK